LCRLSGGPLLEKREKWGTPGSNWAKFAVAQPPLSLRNSFSGNYCPRMGFEFLWVHAVSRKGTS